VNILKSAAARRSLQVIASGLMVTLVAGCGMSSLTSGIGGGMLGGSSSSNTEIASVSEDQLLTAAKADYNTTASAGIDAAHNCPRFIVSPTGNHVTIYEQGRIGDALAVMHRGEITKTARECYIENGRVTVKYGFSGRVLLGPRGQAGTIRLPVNVYVNDPRREKLTQDAMAVDVAVSVDRPIGYFSVVRTVSFPLQEGTRPAEYEVLVGFDRNLPNAG
jgi:hypothetical protein